MNLDHPQQPSRIAACIGSLFSTFIVLFLTAASFV